MTTTTSDDWTTEATWTAIHHTHREQQWLTETKDQS